VSENVHSKEMPRRAQTRWGAYNVPQNPVPGLRRKGREKTRGGEIMGGNGQGRSRVRR